MWLNLETYYMFSSFFNKDRIFVESFKGPATDHIKISYISRNFEKEYDWIVIYIVGTSYLNSEKPPEDAAKEILELPTDIRARPKNDVTTSGIKDGYIKIHIKRS